MPVDTFDEFVRQHTEQARQFAEALNPKERLGSWRSELDSLYEEMKGYLKDYTDSGKIRIETRSVQLTEAGLGSYEAPALAIMIGNDEVTVEPVAALLIGCSGRVDLSGPYGISRIALLEKSGPVEKVMIPGAGNQKEASSRSPLRGEIDRRGWYVVTRPPDAIATPLNADSFRDAIMDVSGG